MISTHRATLFPNHFSVLSRSTFGKAAHPPAPVWPARSHGELVLTHLFGVSEFDYFHAKKLNNGWWKKKAKLRHYSLSLSMNPLFCPMALYCDSFQGPVACTWIFLKVQLFLIAVWPFIHTNRLLGHYKTETFSVRTQVWGFFLLAYNFSLMTSFVGDVCSRNFTS